MERYASADSEGIFFMITLVLDGVGKEAWGEIRTRVSWRLEGAGP